MLKNPRLRRGAFLVVGLLVGCTRGGPEGSSTGGSAAGKNASESKADGQPDLMVPSTLAATAPATFKVRLETTKGDVVMTVTREWAPRGADRFYNLVKAGFYDGVAFFRVIKGFMAQSGIHGDPKIAARWSDASIQDDPVGESNTRGMVSFATAGPNTRTTQFFINFADNSRLDQMGFAPFGKVDNMRVVDGLYSGYGEGAPRGRGPSQPRIRNEGNDYLKKDFPRLDYIVKATVE